MLENCRARLDGQRAAIARQVPHPDEEVPPRLCDHYRLLAQHGRVVWGAIAQVNNGMFRPGDRDLPGVTAYSPDPYFDGLPQELLAVARSAFDLKNSVPADADLKTVAARMTDEHDMRLYLRLPDRLTEGREAALGATQFHRARLPDGVLSASVFPLVIAPGRTTANMVLPLDCWPDWLRVRWPELNEMLEQLPVRSKARQVAQAAPKRPPDRRPTWDVEAIPVRVTGAAARAFRAAIAAEGMTGPVYLRVGFATGRGRAGRPTVDLDPDYDPQLDRHFLSGGVEVVIDLAHLDALRGAEVDHTDDEFGKGFLIRGVDYE
jgi:Fe-S cluster assembly iron-binding protein IscA